MDAKQARALTKSQEQSIIELITQNAVNGHREAIFFFKPDTKTSRKFRKLGYKLSNIKEGSFNSYKIEW